MTRPRLSFGILRILRGDRLDCGCLVGVYETYAGSTLTIIDVPGSHCRASGHVAGARFDGSESDEPGGAL